MISCTNIKDKQVHTFLGLNTTNSITVFNEPEVDLLMTEKIVLEIDSLMSSHLTTSDISKINNLAGKDYYKPDPKTLEVIKEGIKYGSISNGDFDVTIGPLVKLWNIGETTTIPDTDKINTALDFVNFKNILINDNGEVKLTSEFMAIDLGGIAKGYASNEVKKYLLSIGVKSAIINLGGNIDVIGLKANGSLWNLGIQHPRKSRGEYIGILKAENKSFITSGDYERYSDINGVRYHHILSTKDGFPKNGEIISSSILSENSIMGDALSTITFAKSIDELKKFREDFSFEGVFITNNNGVYVTPGLKELFTLKDETYKIIP